MHSNLVKHKTIIAACHFTGVHDVNRNTVLLSNDYSYVKKWADSITALGLTGILFTTTFLSTLVIYIKLLILFLLRPRTTLLIIRMFLGILFIKIF